MEGSSGNRFQDVTNLSIAINTRTKKSRIVTFALSQLSREDKREKKREPDLSDLRESGQLEQDANSVLLLYPEDPEDKSSDRICKIAKNRNGRLGRMKFYWNGQQQRFTYAAPPKPKKHRNRRKLRDRTKPKKIRSRKSQSGLTK